MLDAVMRRLIDPPLNQAGAMLAARGISANAVTIAGFLCGVAAFPALALQSYMAALVMIVLNRLADGLDGAVARHTRQSDLGGYLDIVLDFIVYSGVIFFFCLGRPEFALWGAALIFSFIGTGSSFLAYAILAERHKIETAIRGKKSLYYLGGLAEGTETFIALVLICLFPDWFAWIAGIFAAMCWLTTAARIKAAVDAFG